VIEWARGAEAIARQIRAFNPWPIAETRLDGEQLRIHGACVGPAPAQVTAAPGTITVTSEGEVLVACGTGTLRLTEVQRPGRRPVSGRDLANSAALAGRRLG
jgi:methionyl-tRNA formyltransferase